MQQSEPAQAARLASTGPQAERAIPQQERQHAREVEDIQRGATRRITGQGKHTAEADDSQCQVCIAKASTKQQAALPPTSFPIKPVALPPADTGASSSSSAPAPTTKAKGERGRPKTKTAATCTQHEADKPEDPPRKTRAGRSALPEPTQTTEDNTRRSRSRSRAKSASTYKYTATPSKITLQPLQRAVSDKYSSFPLVDQVKYLLDMVAYKKEYSIKDVPGNTQIKYDICNENHI